ncbi:hypothetical protein MMC30_007093 [Trapelia coarctata]|nr:hypothetical protein [Trapelia coarctata]
MAKSVVDLADLLDVIVDPLANKPDVAYADALPGSWSDLRVGVLDSDVWYFDAELQKPVAAASEQITKKTRAAELDIDREQCMYALWTADFKATINEYLAGLQSSKVRTLDELIQFNKDNAEKELPEGIYIIGHQPLLHFVSPQGPLILNQPLTDFPNQALLLAASKDHPPRARHAALLAHARHIGRTKGIDHTPQKYNIDVIIAPADPPYNLLVSAAGYPSATLPMGYLKYYGRPIGLGSLRERVVRRCC